MKIKDIMRKKFACIHDDATVREVSGSLIKHKLSGMPVIDNKGNLAGFVSERDIIKAISRGSSEKKCIKKLMTRRVITLQEEASIEQASKIFHTNPFRYVPVKRKKRVVGIVSRKDVIDKLVGQYY